MRSSTHQGLQLVLHRLGRHQRINYQCRSTAMREAQSERMRVPTWCVPHISGRL